MDKTNTFLDADLTVILPIWIDPSEVANNELYQRIPSVLDGKSIIFDADTSNTFSTGAVPALNIKRSECYASHCCFYKVNLLRYAIERFHRAYVQQLMGSLRTLRLSCIPQINCPTCQRDAS